MVTLAATLALLQGQRVYFDTNIFVYVFGQSEQWGAVSAALFEACANQDVQGLTGEVTLAELLVKPLRDQDHATVQLVEHALLDSGVFGCVPVNRSTWRMAAGLRATRGFKMMDSLQLACAIEASADCFVTNDAALANVVGLNVFQISSMSV